MKSPITALTLVTLLAACSGEATTSNAAESSATGETSGAPKFSHANKGEQLPNDFPGDIPLADSMSCVSIAKVGDAFMVSFQAEETSLDELVDWFKAEMPKQGWSLDSIVVDAKSAILPFTKAGRDCGVSISAFVMNATGQMDESACTITIQTQAQESQ